MKRARKQEITYIFQVAKADDKIETIVQKDLQIKNVYLHKR